MGLLDLPIPVYVNRDLNISYLFGKNDNTPLWICGWKKPLIIFRFRIILWSILTFFRVSHFCGMSFSPFCPPILKPYLKKGYSILCNKSLGMISYVFTFTCDSDIPNAKASFALSGPARYLVCSKVFSSANICCPENVGRVCFRFPSEFRTTFALDDIPTKEIVYFKRADWMIR